MEYIISFEDGNYLEDYEVDKGIISEATYTREKENAFLFGDQHEAADVANLLKKRFGENGYVQEYLKKESINHPDHYQSDTIEVIDIIEAFDLGFKLGNTIKYILRAGKKENRQEDLKKALWYLEREIEKGK